MGEFSEVVFKFLEKRHFTSEICCMVICIHYLVSDISCSLMIQRTYMYNGLTVMIYFFLFFGGGIAATMCGALLTKCSATMHFN